MKEILIGYYYSLLQTFDNYQHNPHPELEDTVFPVFRFIRTVCDKKHKNEIVFYINKVVVHKRLCESYN